MIKRVTRLELNTMFSAPISWLVLVGVAVFTTVTIIASIQGRLIGQELYPPFMQSLTAGLLASGNGALYVRFSELLMLIIPLLCMGIISREKASDSIKLLYSSPISMADIVLGKYFAAVCFSALVCLLIGLGAVATGLSITDTDVGLMVSGLLTLFLLAITYSAISLYFSTLTKYPILDVVATVGLLGVLTLIGNFMRDVPVVGELFYWLAIPQHTARGIQGLLLSRDVGYFLLISFLFVYLAYQRLQQEKRTSEQRLSGRVRIAAVIVLVLTVGYIISAPSRTLYMDMTENQSKTISKQGQQILSQFEGPVTITTYGNLLGEGYYPALPKSQISDKHSFEGYERFLPELNYKYQLYHQFALSDERIAPDMRGLSERQLLDAYLDNERLDKADVPSAAELSQKVDLAYYGYISIRVFEYNGRQAVMVPNFDERPSAPTEGNYLTVFKSLLEQPIQIRAVVGHGERSVTQSTPSDWQRMFRYWPNRHSLVNSGFGVEPIALSELQASNYPDVLVIANPKQAYTESELTIVEKYLATGGDLILATEPGSAEASEPLLNLLGLRQVEGVLVTNSADSEPTSIAMSGGGKTVGLNMPGVTLNGAAVLRNEHDAGFVVESVWQSQGDHIWLDSTGPDHVGQVAFDAVEGDQKGPHAAALALTRDMNGKQQKILVTGDADIFSNAPGSYRPAEVSLALARWFSNDQYPVMAESPEILDHTVSLSFSELTLMKWIGWGAIPLIIATTGWVSWRRRRFA